MQGAHLRSAASWSERSHYATYICSTDEPCTTRLRALSRSILSLGDSTSQVTILRADRGSVDQGDDTVWTEFDHPLSYPRDAENRRREGVQPGKDSACQPRRAGTERRTET